MRAIILGLGLLAAPTSKDGPDLKPFSFLRYVAGETIAPPLLKGCGKGPDVTCTIPLFKLSNVYAGLFLTTHDYKLSTLYVDAHPNSFPDLFEAFSTKYGKPCEAMVTIWKNAGGVELENPTFEWCFSTGRLHFSKYGAQIDKMGIFYEDENKQKNLSSAINF